jgi:hypothetical protein
MSDEELLRFSGDHIQYELEMTFLLAPLLLEYATRQTFNDNIIKNALLESFVAHVRVLKTFLYDEAKWDDDVPADQYVRDVEAWHQARGAVPQVLAGAAQRVGKEIVHLTRGRHDPDAPERDWNPIVIRDALVQPLKMFLRMARPGLLDWRVQQLITDLSESSAPGGAES